MLFRSSFIELRLDESKLLADPAVVQIIEPNQTSSADQTILLSDLWRESYKIPNTDIFTTTTTSIQDVALPSAGYVSLDDVDVTVFSLDGQLSLDPGLIETIGVGTTVWAAKINKYDWGVYRCADVPGHITTITTNLNSSAIAQFTTKHGLSVDDIVIIRFVDSTVDGVYKVL